VVKVVVLETVDPMELEVDEVVGKVVGEK